MWSHEPEQPREIARCAYCCYEIYEGDEVARIDDDGGFVHNGWRESCAKEYAMERVYDAKGTIDKYGNINE